MKFDIQKEPMSQSSYFKSRPDLVMLGGVVEGNRNFLNMIRVERLG